MRVCLLKAEGGLSYPEIDDDPEAWHELLGGYMEPFKLPYSLWQLGLVGLADEDGYRKDLRVNPYSVLLGRQIVGPVVIARAEPPEFVDLTERDMIAIDEWFGHTIMVVIG